MNEKTIILENSIGKIKATSMSKTKKITTTMKNFMQKGNREILLGSNPHSKGEAFSLSITDLYVSNIINIKIMVIIKHVVIYIAIYIILALLLSNFQSFI